MVSRSTRVIALFALLFALVASPALFRPIKSNSLATSGP